MSSLFAMSKFLGGRSRERRRQDSTSSLVSGSTDSIASRGAPKTPPSKLSNVVSSNLISSSLSTLTAGRTTTDSIIESSSDSNSISASSYFRVPLADNLASDAPPGFAGPISAEETLHQSEAQDTEDTRNRAQKRIQELEEERDRALVHARDARELQEKGQTQIQELENTLKSVEAELSSKATTLDALTTSSDGLRMQIDILKVDLQKAKSISKNVEEERDRVIDLGREANDARAAANDALNDAQSRVRELEDAFKSIEAEVRSKAETLNALNTSSEEKQLQIAAAQGHIQALEHELTLKSQTISALTAEIERMQSKVNALTTDLRKSVAASKNLEEERDRAQRLHAAELEDVQMAKEVRIRELENDLESTRTELKSKSETIVALTTTSGALGSRIAALETELLVCTQELQHERAQGQVQVREAEQQRDNLDKYARNMEEERDKAILSAQDAHVKAQTRIQDLEEELSSKSQTFNALTVTSNGLESQIDALTIDLHNILAVRKGVEDEWDSALIRARDLGDAHEKAQAQNHALEEALQYAKTEDSEKSRTIDNLSVASKGLQSQIDALKLNLDNALVLSKLREDERDEALNHLREANKAQATVQEHAQELENGLRSTKDDLTSKSQALEALTANSKAQKAEIDTMKSNLRDALAFGKDVAMERDSALTRVRESEDRREKAQAQIQSLKNALQSTKAELNSKSQAVDALTIGSKGLQLEIDALKVAHRDALDAWTRREVERDAALIQAQAHIQELKDTLKAIKARVSKYFILTGIVSIIAALVDAVV